MEEELFYESRRGVYSDRPRGVRVKARRKSWALGPLRETRKALSGCKLRDSAMDLEKEGRSFSLDTCGSFVDGSRLSPSAWILR